MTTSPPGQVEESPIERALWLACSALAQIGIGILIVFAASTVLDGITRWLLNWPLDIVRDIGGVWIAVGISCCFPLAFLEGRNIVMDLAESVVSATTNRLLDVVSSLAVAGFLFLFAHQFWLFAQKTARAGETSMTLEIPIASFWYAVDANLWFTLIIQLAVVSRAFHRLVTGTGRLSIS